ncbi:Predicted PurR-regulated permease PerM [Mariniphaga anaerophila]|uniref:Predicted PurR-regulated permease PerM n=1 Tax=Mariniphaga anaerophila TaxID=1484053 RepID=A0A1M5DCA2_9BACT|nr:AI-2E family transporter [Mariniphaga anaerophila]SHF64577.1 Predicted PurR-regulated permease PerM [Mariniphaga anaerophila]
MVQLKGWARNVLLIAGGIFLIFLLWYFSAIVTYILISLVLSFIGRPLVRWLSMVEYKKFRISKGIAAFITLVAIWFIFISFFRFIIPLLVKELETLSEIDLKAFFNSIEEPVMKLMRISGNDPMLVEDKSFYDIVVEQLTAKINFSQLPNFFASVAGTIGELLIGFFSVSFITFFFLKEKSMARESILLLVPTEIESKVSHILDSISYLLRRYFVGIILEVFMVMLLDTVGLSLVGLSFNHAVIIGFFCGLFNVIPYLGPWMGAALGLLIGAALNIHADFVAETLPLLGLMTIVFISVQVIDNVLFQPLIYSSSVKAHPLEIFLVIIAAGSLAGVLGMFLAIPAYTIVRVVAKEFFVNMKLVRKLTENLEKEE